MYGLSDEVVVMKSDEYMRGFTTALVFLSDVFESHSDAFMRKCLLRKKDTKFVVNVIDAAIRRRETLADVGPKQMNIFVRPDRSVDLKEK